jgi:hypothetical protein
MLSYSCNVPFYRIFPHQNSVWIPCLSYPNYKCSISQPLSFHCLRTPCVLYISKSSTFLNIVNCLFTSPLLCAHAVPCTPLFAWHYEDCTSTPPYVFKARYLFNYRGTFTLSLSFRIKPEGNSLIPLGFRLSAVIVRSTVFRGYDPVTQQIPDLLFFVIAVKASKPKQSHLSGVMFFYSRWVISVSLTTDLLDVAGHRLLMLFDLWYAYRWLWRLARSLDIRREVW